MGERESAELLLQYLVQKRSTPKADGCDQSPQQHHGRTPTDELPMSAVMAFAGTILTREILGGANLANFYGGGYELVTAERREDGTVSLTKVPAIAYVFWVVSEDRNRLSLRQLVNFRYQGDCYSPRVLSWSRQTKRTCSVSANSSSIQFRRFNSVLGATDQVLCLAFRI